MNAKSLRLLFALLTVPMFPVIPACRGTLVTFDELSETASGSYLANGYQGLSLSNFAVKNAVLFAASFGSNGTYYGMLSASNVVLNGIAGPAEIDSPGTNFNFLSAYMTGLWNSNLNIEAQGFRNGSLMYDQ